MYGFALKLSPEDLEAVAAQLYVEMLKSGFSVVGEFQYLHHQPDGTPYDEPAEMSLALHLGGGAGGHRHHHAADALQLMAASAASQRMPGQRRFINDAERFLRIHETLQARVREQSAAPARHFAA